MQTGDVILRHRHPDRRPRVRVGDRIQAVGTLVCKLPRLATTGHSRLATRVLSGFTGELGVAGFFQFQRQFFAADKAKAMTPTDVVAIAIHLY